MKIECPHCHKQYECDVKWKGREVRCGACGDFFVIEKNKEQIHHERTLYVEPTPSQKENDNTENNKKTSSDSASSKKNSIGNIVCSILCVLYVAGIILMTITNLYEDLKTKHPLEILVIGAILGIVGYALYEGHRKRNT